MRFVCRFPGNNETTHESNTSFQFLKSDGFVDVLAVLLLKVLALVSRFARWILAKKAHTSRPSMFWSCFVL